MVTGLEEDGSEVCSVCENLLCDGRCESSPVSQLVTAGLGGASLVLLVALIRWLLT